MGVLSFINDLQQLKLAKAAQEQMMQEQEANRQAEAMRLQARLAGDREVEGMRGKNNIDLEGLRNKGSMDLENLRARNAQVALDTAEVGRQKALDTNLRTTALANVTKDPVLATAYARDKAAEMAVNGGLAEAQGQKNLMLRNQGAEAGSFGAGQAATAAETARSRYNEGFANEGNATLAARKDWIPFIAAQGAEAEYAGNLANTDENRLRGATAMRRFESAPTTAVARDNAETAKLGVETAFNTGLLPFSQEGGQFEGIKRISDATRGVNTNNRAQDVEDHIPVSAEAEARKRAMQSTGLSAYSGLLNPWTVQQYLEQNPQLKKQFFDMLLGGTNTTARPAAANPKTTQSQPRQLRVEDLNGD